MFLRQFARILGISALITSIAPFSAVFAQDDPRPLTIDDLMAMKSVSSPVISPDGDLVVYSMRVRDMDEDKSNSQLFMVPTAGGDPIPMTSVDTSAGNAQWSPDG
jgi:hypothetical protein